MRLLSRVAAASIATFVLTLAACGDDGGSANAKLCESVATLKSDLGSLSLSSVTNSDSLQATVDRLKESADAVRDAKGDVADDVRADLGEAWDTFTDDVAAAKDEPTVGAKLDGLIAAVKELVDTLTKVSDDLKCP